MTPEASFGRRLAHFVDASNKTHSEYLSDPELLRQYEQFVSWQNSYMLPFYDEFQQPETQAAVDFVLTDLTGIGISSRDQDLSRVVPVMTRVLPDKALQTVAQAMELNSRVLASNLKTCRRLKVSVDLDSGGISEKDYCIAFRETTTFEKCVELVSLVITAGRSLQRIVKIPMMGLTLKTMHYPAHASGLGALQEFLERGYSTFRSIHSLDYFLERLEERMTALFSHICNAPLDELDDTPLRVSNH